MSDRIVTLPDEVAALVDGAVESGQFDSDQALFRAAVEEYFDRHDEDRVEAAVQLYADERVSMGRAAEMVGVFQTQMEEIVADRGVESRLGEHEETDVADELETARSVLATGGAE